MEPRDADPWELVRFLREQVGMHEAALRELRAGRKTGHWIWYEFPQLAGLGMSSMSRRFAISGLDEARAYLAHPVLRPRLIELCDALLIHRERAAADLLGHVDAVKVRSSMTLFLRAEPGEPVFRRVLDAFYDGQPDPRTDELLAG
ncbi:MAG TPA: DUF1810 domain-containing protein [Candidatus Limnocylindrales bacterium]|nr:DUF1810 domain-containing protein [Candidatus Limnocylindrales bacterium]